MNNEMICKYPVKSHIEYIKYKASCHNKNCHKSKEKAKKERERLSSEYKESVFQMYQCSFCKYWHIGKNKKAENAKRHYKQVRENMKKIIKKLSKEEREILGQFISGIINKMK